MPESRANNPAIDGMLEGLARHERDGGEVATARPPTRHDDQGAGVLQQPDIRATDSTTAHDAIVTLETLTCLELTNHLERRTEPYIWPALIWADNTTVNSAQPILVGTISAGNARKVIKSSMGVGETAPIPASVGTLRVRFDPTVEEKHLIVVVGLLENDETPIRAIRAGFRSFVSALTVAVANKLSALAGATGEELKAIIDEIKQQVAAAVDSAIKANLTNSEKFQVAVGILDPDDTLGAGFVAFENAQVVSGPITIAIEQTGRRTLPPVPTRSRFEVRGRLRVQPVVVDPCQKQVQAVTDAQAVVAAVEKEIEQLQKQLTGGAEDEGPAPADDILELIRQLREDELAPAVAALEAARAALVQCRTGTTGPRG